MVSCAGSASDGEHVGTIMAAAEVVVEIGGIAVLLRAADERLMPLLQSRFGTFAGSGRSPDFFFDIEVIDGSALSDPDADVSVTASGSRWLMERGDFRAEWDSQSREGRIRQTLTPYAIDSVLRIVHSLALAQEGGFLLHAASAVRNGKAFLFSGVSTAGKTTISQLAPPDVSLLTDEASYVRKSGEAYVAYGTPFAGEMGTPGVNTSGPIEALYFLGKGESNHFEEIPRPEALRMLMRNILFFAKDEELVNRVFEGACAFLDRVPARRLVFYPDQRAWDLIR